MLTLQQLLESDSLATVVAKLNQNFQSLTLSNGGPQGIIGRQGIPGLPGRVGPHGPTGPQGPTGTIAGVIPFANIPGTGSTAGPDFTQNNNANYGKVGPWPQSSYQWLKYYHSNGVNFYGVQHVGGATPRPNDIFIDHANNGYWKFLVQLDEPGAHNEFATPPYTNQAPYSYAGTTQYPDLSTSLGWVGAGWYYYPTGDVGNANLTTVWLQDTSTYLLSNMGATGETGPYPLGVYEQSGSLEIPNARLITKYGTVWITSGNDATDTGGTYSVKDTSTIGLWGIGSGSTKSQPARNNAGVDRLLFKMSLDGLPYMSNLAARGIPVAAPIDVTADTTYPQRWLSGIGDQMTDETYWVSPMYNVSLEKYTPLLFLTHRVDETDPDDGTYGSLGIYIFTDTTSADLTVPRIPDDLYGTGTYVKNNNVSKTIHLFSSRYTVDPLVMFDPNFSQITSASTKNYGEMILDFRRVVASNQYVCGLPTDLKLSSDYIVGSTNSTKYYNERSSSNLDYRFKTNQGYISAINGKAVTGNFLSADYWEYGLGSDSPSVNYPLGGTHDTASGFKGMSTRRAWYGSSVMSSLPSEWLNGTLPGENNYIRVAGMMERGRRVKHDFDNDLGYLNTSFLSELIFYTSAFKVDPNNLLDGVGVTNDLVDPINNEHKSLPSLYVSPYRSIGIGTFVGGYLSANDQGPLEPSAKIHVHLKQPETGYDPTEMYRVLPAGAGNYSTLPRKTYAVAAFSSETDQESVKGNTDILIGALISPLNEKVNLNDVPVNDLRQITLRNAIRSEAWQESNLSTLRLGAQPGRNYVDIGRSSVEAFKNEFQIALHPLTTTGADLTNSLTAITGVGIHNMYPKARVHFFGKNTYNEAEYGPQPWRPGYMSSAVGATFPYFGNSSVNSPSANQVIIDYIGDSYKYPIGLYEYQYYVFNIDSNPVSTGLVSANSAAYPSKEKLSPTRYAVPYGSAGFLNQSYPSTSPQARFVVGGQNTYKHGGTENAWWEPSSFIGFNLYRDLSSIQSINLGDNKDTTRWTLGTQGTDGRNHGNNGGAGIISSNTGEIGIITIPRGRDGGRAYEEWEQNGLGTRDVLNQIKIIFDKNGNIAMGNAAGWDLDAYPSLVRNMSTGYLNYVPLTLSTTSQPATALNASTYVYSLQTSGARRYGGVNYANITPETLTASTAALVNNNATTPEYIRLEIGAEKAWSRDGRMVQKVGYGYPPNVNLVIPSSLLSKYIMTTVPTASIVSWTLQTDFEGRILNNTFRFSITPAPVSSTPTPTAADFVAIFPHPQEFNTGGVLSGISGAPASFLAPAGAMAAEWWGMSTDSPTFNNQTLLAGPSVAGSNITAWNINFITTTDTKGSANVRLNNFIYGEGYGFGGVQESSDEITDPSSVIEYTKSVVRKKRQESPKFILSFLEKTPNDYEAERRDTASYDPYLKVNTVIASAQNEAALREYWIPKTDNTGGTFMVFTDHFGKKEKDSGFDDESIVTKEIGGARRGLHLEEVVTQEFLAGYNGSGLYNMTQTVLNNQNNLIVNTDYAPKDMYPGYVRYYNKSYNQLGQLAVWPPDVYAQLVDVGSSAAQSFGTGGGSSNPTTSTTTGGSAAIAPMKSSYRITALADQASQPPIAQAVLGGNYQYYNANNNSSTLYHCEKQNHDGCVGSANCFTVVFFGVEPWNNGNNSPTVTFNPMGAGYNGYMTSTKTGSVNGNGLVAPVTGSYKLVFSNTSLSSTTQGGGGYIGQCDKSDIDVGGDFGTTTKYKTNNLLQTIPSSGSVTLSMTAGQEISLETTWYGYSEWRNKCGLKSCSDSCDSNTCYLNTNPTITMSGTVSLYYQDATCSQTPADNMVKIAIGEYGDLKFQKPSGSAYPCPVHTFLNVYDTNSTYGGTHDGSIAEHYLPGGNDQYVIFRVKPIAHAYDGVKITINFAGRTPGSEGVYTAANKDLILRFLTPMGQAYSANEMGGGSLNMYINGGGEDVVYGIIPGKQTTAGLYEYDGTCEIYMTKALWESGLNNSKPYWVLCGAFFPNGAGSTNPNNFVTACAPGSAWEIDRLSITFEELISNTTAQTSTTTTTTSIPTSAFSDGSGSEGANRSSIRRNIDHFYSLYSPAYNYDMGWNTVDNTENAPVIDNAASQIRMKRINSEFALVDFNITVKVDNPWLPFSGGEATPDARTSLVDFGSPRFTQYLRFTYIPDEAFFAEDQYRQDIAQDLFGNGMWFSNWSSYRNWLPGTAIVGDDVLNNEYNNSGAIGNKRNYGGAYVGFQQRNVSSDWSPTFNDENGDDISYRFPFNRTWNGNLLEMLSFKNQVSWKEMAFARGSTNYGILSNPLGNINIGQINDGGVNDGPGQSVFSAFGGDGRMLRLANMAFNYTSSPSSAEMPQKQKSFVGFLGGMHALWGNQAFERNTNTQWRMSPTYNYIADETVESAQQNNNGFSLEVQFSKPILHVDTSFGAGIYGSTEAGAVCQPYRFLTVSGQGIVRYAQTIKKPLPTVQRYRTRGGDGDGDYIGSLYE